MQADNLNGGFADDCCADLFDVRPQLDRHKRREEGDRGQCLPQPDLTEMRRKRERPGLEADDAELSEVDPTQPETLLKSVRVDEGGGGGDTEALDLHALERILSNLFQQQRETNVGEGVAVVKQILRETFTVVRERSALRRKRQRAKVNG
jgi:hypothetical protein